MMVLGEIGFQYNLTLGFKGQFEKHLGHKPRKFDKVRQWRISSIRIFFVPKKVQGIYIQMFLLGKLLKQNLITMGMWWHFHNLGWIDGKTGWIDEKKLNWGQTMLTFLWNLVHAFEILSPLIINSLTKIHFCAIFLFKNYLHSKFGQI